MTVEDALEEVDLPPHVNVSIVGDGEVQVVVDVEDGQLVFIETSVDGLYRQLADMGYEEQLRR